MRGTGSPEGAYFVRVLQQVRYLSNFKGQRWGSEELGQGTWVVTSEGPAGRLWGLGKEKMGRRMI
jgi:hypothetical protein